MNIIDIIIAMIYGIVEGITEWLPISSTGHLIILNDFLKFKEVNSSFFELFLVVIQFGAILSVVVSYFKRLNPFSKKVEQINKYIAVQQEELKHFETLFQSLLQEAFTGVLTWKYPRKESND